MPCRGGATEDPLSTTALPRPVLRILSVEHCAPSLLEGCMGMDTEMKDAKENAVIEKLGDPLFVESVRKGFAVLDALNEVQEPMRTKA